MTTIQTAPKAPASQTAAGLSIERIRADFPILKLQVNGKPLVYLRQCGIESNATTGDR
jgi:selenocysteine lyase/cysteine desulfurase